MKSSPLGGFNLGPSLMVLRSFRVGTVTLANFLASFLVSVKLFIVKSSSLNLSFDLSGLRAKGRRSAKALALSGRVGVGVCGEELKFALICVGYTAPPCPPC